jgi:NADH-quinone oxidoreductase subunit L
MIQAIVFLPLIGFLIAGAITLFGRHRVLSAEPVVAGHGHHDHHHASATHDSHGHGDDHHAEAPGARAAEVITTGLLGICALLSWIVLWQTGFGGQTQTVTLFRWIHVGSFVADWALRVDTLTAVMLVVVTNVSALVHLYSIGYMSHDEHRPRFMAYLSLFTFAMLMLVTADNFIQLFFGWEGVGLASYLLIGFWFKKASANNASMKAFIVNRVGDFGFALGVFGVFLLFGSVSFDTVFAAASDKAGMKLAFLGMQLDALTIVCLLLFVGAMGKSAQFLLHTWLPDAMEGPTPVSALIHAATMVTAGVFMVARLSPMMEYAPIALAVVTFVGALTAIFAASVGLVQNDIKRVVAYSTCSQLGFMFVALGVGAYSVAIFHLFTHAFFKALLFLGAGSVIHAVSGEQDIRRMGGLRKQIPLTYWMMMIGTLALTGVGIPMLGIGFAGFFSKDAIIEAAFASTTDISKVAFILLAISALMTSFYSWRLMFLVFHGKSRLDPEAAKHVHESPLVMTIPLGLLAFGAVVAGWVFKKQFADEKGVEAFFGDAIYLSDHNHILHGLHEVPVFVLWTPFVAMILGLLLAWYLYIKRTDLPAKLAAQQQILYRFLLNKWYFDELFDWMFVRPARFLGTFLWKQGDGRVIDGLGPNALAARVNDLSKQVVRLQSGYLYHYAFAMLVGVSVLVTWYMMTGGTK